MATPSGLAKQTMPSVPGQARQPEWASLNALEAHCKNPGGHLAAQRSVSDGAARRSGETHQRKRANALGDTLLGAAARRATRCPVQRGKARHAAQCSGAER